MASRFDPQPPDRSGPYGVRSKQPKEKSAPVDNSAEAGAPQGLDLLGIVAQAERLSKDYQSRTIDRPLSRAYRAWQNQHAEGSKYLGTAFKGRSRLFVPKTRSAVRKNLAGAAAALFSTDDVVNVTATLEDDDVQRASAAVLKADLDYRLNLTSAISGVPWFLIAMGGCLDGQLTGVTISKQFWEFEEIETNEPEMEMVQATDDFGALVFDELGQPVMVERPVVELIPILDEETGEPVIDGNGEEYFEERPVFKKRVIKDRPMCELHPIENAGLDPAAPWYAPAQLGRWFYMRYPMGISDVRAMMASKGKGGQDSGWLEVSDELLMKGRIEEDRSGSRRVREGGSDRYQDGKAPGELDIVWIQENFIRIEGKDYHFWSVGRHGFLSVVRETREVYPEYDGDRPYVFGVSQLDTHRVFPMSPVESWQPLQLELNDITNLRQDTLKRAIAPLAIVKRGKNVDIGMVQRRGQPDAVLLADDPLNDVRFQQTPGPTGAAYTETSLTNSNFDELAGVFSTSSVQQSRQLNETVGGMRMMSSAANSVSEFDLRVWVETWVEPVLRQMMHLVRYHESDERILKIAGSKAAVYKKFGFMPSLSDFEEAELTLKVNVGIGASDPMQKLAKLQQAMTMLAPLYEQLKSQGIKLNGEALIDEIMGAAGFKDGKRFFEFGDPEQPQPDPEIIKTMEEMKFEREKLQHSLKEVMLELRSKETQTAQNNQTKLQIERMKSQRGLVDKMIGVAADRERRQFDEVSQRRQRIMDIFQKGREGQARQIAPRQEARQPAPSYSQPSPMMRQTAPAMPQQPDPSMMLMAQLVERMNAMSERDAMMIGVLRDIHQGIKAPAEIVRDPNTGAAVGVRKAGQFQQIVRGPDNRIAGAVPLG